MVRLSFSLVCLGLILVDWFPCLKKITGKIPADKKKLLVNSSGEKPAGKIPIR